MRVLLLIDSLDSGGAESMVVSLARHLDRARVELHVLGLFDIYSKHRIPSRRILDSLDALGISVGEVGAHNLRDGSSLRRLVSLIREHKIELIHSHLSFSIMWGALASAWTRVPWVATLHGVVDPPVGSRKWVWEQLTRLALHRADRVICVSEAQRQFYLTHTSLGPHRLVTIYNGIALDRFSRQPSTRQEMRRSLGIPDGAPVITTVALLRPEKGHDELLAALPVVLERVPSARFLMVGGGRREQELRAAAAPYGAAVQFLGMRDDVPALMSASDVLVLPSYTEALPTVLLEGMSNGLPVVATRVGGIPEIVQEGETGILVPPRDAAALASAILRLAQSPGEAQAMGERGRARVESVFDARLHAQKVADLYEQVGAEHAHTLAPSAFERRTLRG